MKITISQKVGLFLLIVGSLLFWLWGYMKVLPSIEWDRSKQTEVLWSEIPESSNIRDALLRPTITLSMWVVELSVQDLEKMKVFYHDIVGFDIMGSSGNILELGDDGDILLRLIEEKDFTFAKKWEAWLYHIALTHTSRKSLAERLSNILARSNESYQWSADHTVTEAFYFSDPEGNGLELYYDKPRIDWIWQDEKPVMGSAPLDVVKYIDTYLNMSISGGYADMGHVHLKVGDIPEAEKFYSELLLFEVMNNRWDALFVSRDRYHHHLGMNTWESLWAGKRTQDTYGLRSFSILYHERTTYEAVINNLKNAWYPLSWEGGWMKTEDPWGNVISLVSL
jgi:catechol 2,3-dioxygenase